MAPDYSSLLVAILPKIRRLVRRYPRNQRADLEQTAAMVIWERRTQWDPTRRPWDYWTTVWARRAIQQARHREVHSAEIEVSYTPQDRTEVAHTLSVLMRRAKLTNGQKRALAGYLQTGSWQCRQMGSKTVQALREVAI